MIKMFVIREKQRLGIEIENQLQDEEDGRQEAIKEYSQMMDYIFPKHDWDYPNEEDFFHDACVAHDNEVLTGYQDEWNNGDDEEYRYRRELSTKLNRMDAILPDLFDADYDHWEPEFAVFGGREYPFEDVQDAKNLLRMN